MAAFFHHSVWADATAAVGYWFYGVDGADQPYAVVVLGQLSAAGKRESGVPEELPAHPQSDDPSEFAGLYQSAFLAYGPTSARFTLHRRHDALHSRELQFPVVASN